jgi:hypothetical protein
MIQKSKLKKLKSHGLPTFCHLFSYIKREMRDIEKEERKKKKRHGRNKNRNPTNSSSNGHNF